MPRIARMTASSPKFDVVELELLEMMANGSDAISIKHTFHLSDANLDQILTSIAHKFNTNSINDITIIYAQIRDYTTTKTVTRMKYDRSISTFIINDIISESQRFFLIRANLVLLSVASLLTGIAFSAILIFSARYLL